MKYILIAILLVSCSTTKPNYNVGKSHNANRHNREKIVYMQDKGSKKAMKKVIKRSTPRFVKSKKVIQRKTNRYIQ